MLGLMWITAQGGSICAAEDHAGHVLDQGAKFVPTLREAGGCGLHAATVAGVDVEHGEEHQAERRCRRRGSAPGSALAWSASKAGVLLKRSHPVAAGDLDRMGRRRSARAGLRCAEA